MTVLVGAPLPAWLPVLALAAPAVWRLARWSSRYLSRETWTSRILALPLALAMWGIPIHMIAYLSGSIVVGLLVATPAVAALGLFLPSRFAAPPALLCHAPSRWVWLTAALTTALAGRIAVAYNFHDEHHVTGHLAIVAAIGNGYYPPPNLTFPQFELAYHYGFNLLAAILAIFFRLTSRGGIDLVTTLAWGYCWLALWKLGERLLSRRWALLMPTVVLFGGGYPGLCAANLDANLPLGSHIAGLCAKGSPLNPPLFSYFYQHPWGVGLPLAVAIMLLALERGEELPWARRLGLTLLMYALSMSQFTLFLTIGSGLVLAELMRRRRWQDAAWLGALLLSDIAIASRFGGFFAPRDAGMSVVPSDGIGGNLPASVAWHAWTFGLLLPLGIIGVSRLGRFAALFVLAIASSLLVLNAFRYEYTWDIVKFATAASFYLGVPAAVALHRLFSRGFAWSAVATVTLIATVASPVALMLALAADMPTNPGVYPRAHLGAFAPPTPDEEATIAWLRLHVRPPDVALTPADRWPVYSSWGGVPSAYVDNAAGFPFKRERLAARTSLVTHPPADEQEFRRQGVRWFVTEDNRVAVPSLPAWVARATATERFHSGTLHVYELVP